MVGASWDCKGLLQPIQDIKLDFAVFALSVAFDFLI